MAWNNSQQDNAGTTSAWNEGSLKNLRLHEAQQLINTSKINELENYKMWISGINMLYGEGISKYKNLEIEVVERIKKLLSNRIKLFPPQTNINHSLLGSSVLRVLLNEENWEELRGLIYLYEKQVKCFNDIHGLSTRNIDEDDFDDL